MFCKSHQIEPLILLIFILNYLLISLHCFHIPIQGTATSPGSSPTPPFWSGASCPKEYKPHTAYDEGETVTVDKIVYQCAQFPNNLFCGMTGYQPGVHQHWNKAWMIIGSCIGDVPPQMEDPTFEALGSGNAAYGCPKEFSSAVTYVGGDSVTVSNRVFRCKAWPYR